jgi:hypothetical protein
MTTYVDPQVIVIAGGTLALPRLIRTALLPRVLGLYIAGCAGAIQLLDITVDRLALDDRFFTFAIILAIIGIPFAAAGAILAEAARSERRPQRTGRLVTPRSNAEPSTGSAPTRGIGAGEAEAPDSAPPLEPPRPDLPRRLELALSFRHIAELHGRNGEEAEADEFRLRSRRELEALIEELVRMVDDAR